MSEECKCNCNCNTTQEVINTRKELKEINKQLREGIIVHEKVDTRGMDGTTGLPR